MRYKLLPDLVDQTPGDAVPLYLMMQRSWPDARTTSEILYPEKNTYDYLSTPIDQFPRQYTQRLLDGYARTLAYADLGARRRDAHWDIGWRELDFYDQQAFVYCNDMRHSANLLNFRARYQISQGDWPAAQYTFQTAFSMAQHLGTEPLMIQSLVETGLAEIELSDPMEDWISHAGSPNLYWPLTDLPQPFVQLRAVAQWERLQSRYSKTLVDQALRGELLAAQWPQAIREMVSNQMDHSALPKPDPAQVESQAKRLIASSEARARQYLLSHGFAKDKVDSTPADQAVGMYWCAEFHTATDEVSKFSAFPFPEAMDQMMRLWQAMAPDKSPVADNPLIQELLASDMQFHHPGMPIPLRWRFQLARTDRHIAMLRVIEVLRNYAAHHDGKPPERLEQITDVTIPIDPFTGKDFSYHLEGQTAILEALAPPMMSKASGWRFELTFVK